MIIRRFVLPALTVVALLATSLTAQAQTGPVIGDGKGATKGQGGPVGQTVMTADSIAALLKSKGHTATVQPGNNGSKNVVVAIKAGGWQYDVIITVLADGKEMDIFSPLTPAGQTLTQNQMQALLKKNCDLVGTMKYFIVGPQDNRLWLVRPNLITNISEAVFIQVLDSHLATIRDTFDLWKAQ